MISKKFSLNKGILIAVEGIDGAGKTTQVTKIKNYFSRYGFKVSTFKEPTDGMYGKQIRNLAIHGRHLISSEDEMELFIKDRREDCKNNIIPALKKNHLVVMDRYYFSNIAYQGALDINTKHIQKRNEEIAVVPDLVIILDLAVHIGLSRIIDFRNEKHNHFEEEDYLEKVRKIFKKMSKPYIQEINASSDEDDVFKTIKNILEDIITPHIIIEKDQMHLFKNLENPQAEINAIFN